MPLRFRSQQQLTAIPLLVGLLFGLDLLWAALGGPVGSLAFGLVDEPAHLLTCLIALLALSALFPRPLSRAFLLAALIASVAIDLDHLPGYLGWSGLIGAGARPYSHSLLTVLVLLAFGFLGSRRYRASMLGAAFGIAAHLLRDLATGPGVPLGVPLSDAAVRIPYLAYALPLALSAAAATAVVVRSGRSRGRLAWGLGIGSLLLALLAAGAVPGQGGVAQAKQSPLARSKVAMGIYLPDEEKDPAVLDAYAGAIGQPLAIVHLYKTWAEQPFDPAELEAIWSRGSMPLVTWEPWGEFEGVGVPLEEIVDGARDGYIAEAARDAATWGEPLFVRFAHEMNGTWYPWGRSPVLYKEAWRHVVSIFRREGATNVKWVWTPYVDFGKTSFKAYYPGDAWVDWAGFDGFNWGEPFMSFRKIFEGSYREMLRLTSKPLMIAETGSVEGTPGSKALWIRQALTKALQGFPHIRALVWFSDVHPRGMDWRVDTSASALEALIGQLRKKRYEPPRGFLLSKPPWLVKPLPPASPSYKPKR